MDSDNAKATAPTAPADAVLEGPRSPQSLVGVTVSGRYRIDRLLGEGGMGAVYQAEHTHMRKRCALKVLHPEMSRLPEIVARFEREAMAAAHIEHPHVAAATDFGKLDDGSFFLVLEFVEGKSLRDALDDGPFELGRALHVVRQICTALLRAHSLGIVHRDLKPENVMLVEREGDPDFVKVLDFGIAKVPALIGTNDTSPRTVLTRQGMVYGTPEYMAPEQAMGQDVDARADFYAVGTIAYELLTGRRPFENENFVALLAMQVTSNAPRIAEKGVAVPEEVEALVSRLLARLKDDRFADAREVIAALDAVRANLLELGQAGGFRPPTVSLPSMGSNPGLESALTRSGSYPRLAVTPPVQPPVTEAPAMRRPLALPMVLAGAGAAAMFVFIGVAVVVQSVQRGEAPSAASATSSSAVVDASVGPSASEVLDEEVERARLQVERGNYGAAIEILERVEEKAPTRGQVQELLYKAHLGAKNLKEAMRHVGRWMALDPKADRPRLREEVRNAALTKDGADPAFELLETGMQGVGVDILYDIAWGGSGQQYPAAAARAKVSLAKPSVRAMATKALAVTLELRAAPSCEARFALLTKARDDGDVRTLGLLRPLQYQRGCGFLGRSDCLPCLRRDRSLVDAIAAIEARAKK
jgi:serine/threonine-protein kinase